MLLQNVLWADILVETREVRCGGEYPAICFDGAGLWRRRFCSAGHRVRHGNLRHAVFALFSADAGHGGSGDRAG